MASLAVVAALALHLTHPGTPTSTFVPGAPTCGRTGPWGLDFPGNPLQERSSVSRHGITWEFDADYPVGRYANGDWWVVGPVTITAITPVSTGARNGENINPGAG